MTIPLWTLYIAGLMPYFTVGIAKFAGRGYNNAKPRQWATHLEGWRGRLIAAQQNHFETFPFFATAVLVAILVIEPRRNIDAYCLAFIASRVAYTAAYAANLAWLRSAIWAVGLFCIIAIFRGPWW
jgi:uncharacterized MAPEG superfamily protein